VVTVRVVTVRAVTVRAAPELVADLVKADLVDRAETVPAGMEELGHNRATHHLPVNGMASAKGPATNTAEMARANSTLRKVLLAADKTAATEKETKGVGDLPIGLAAVDLRVPRIIVAKPS